MAQLRWDAGTHGGATRVWRAALGVVATAVAIAGVGCGSGGGGLLDDEFESAGYAGSRGAAPPSGAADGGLAAPDDSGREGGDRAVVEADLYRFVGDRLYVLNAYRGLFVFDVSDPDRPTELGRMALHGSPKEMYVRGDRAYAIVTDWFDYAFGAEGEADSEGGLEEIRGSRVVAIDLSDDAQPTVIGSVALDGYIGDSRMVGDVIYAVANRWSWDSRGIPGTRPSSEMVVTSIDVSDPARPREVAQLTLEGTGWNVHATSDAFLVAHSDWGAGLTTTEVRYIDISSPTGAMRTRGAVRVEGYLREDTALHVHDGQLRILTRADDGRTTKLHIFDLREPDALPLLGSLDYVYEGSLFGTTFDRDRLYMIHYMTIDPLEVVDLSDPRAPFVAGILEMPGWVDRIAALDDRLIGLGIDDRDGGRRVSVSLFDVSDAATPTLLDRVSTGDGRWAWSAAQWDRKAWTVDPSAGIVLFPFSGWDERGYDYHHALGILSFTRETLAVRGEVEAPAPVERGALRDGRVYALSQAALQVVDVRDLDRPRPAATVELARTVDGYARTERIGVELVTPGLGWWGYRTAASPSELRTTPLDRPDGPREQARVALPRRADGLFTHGSLAVAIATQDGCAYYGYEDGAERCGAERRPGITVVDVADPARPRIVADLPLPMPAGTATGGGYRGTDDGYVGTSTSWQSRYGAPIGGWTGGSPALALGGGAYALLRTTSTYCSGLTACRSVGIEPEREEHPEYCDFYGYPTPPRTCGTRVYYHGHRIENALVVLDLSDPARPRLTAERDLGTGSVEQMFVADGELLYSHAVPSRTDARGRTYVRWYAERFALGEGAELRPLGRMNLPGRLIAKRGDALVTLDQQWVDDPSCTEGSPRYYGCYGRMASWLNGLVLRGGRAYRTSMLRLGDDLASVVETGGMVYTVANRWMAAEPEDAPDYGYGTTRTVLAAVDARDVGDLRSVSEQTLSTRGTWWQIATRAGDVLVLSGGGGLALFGTAGADAARPRFRRFVRTQGWTVSLLVDGDTLYASGGPHGIQAVPLGD
jgi:uncharacterized secreted protein with C-terminal beta-propeller domain